MSIKVKWLYKIKEDFRYQSKYTFPAIYHFFDKKGELRLIIDKDGNFTVTKDYSWNGCSPKFNILDLPLGTPDGITDPETLEPKTYYASLVHDALYQFYLDGLPLSRRQADKVFLDIMGKTGFKLRYLYYIGVRLFGHLVLLRNRIFRNNKGQMMRVEE